VVLLDGRLVSEVELSLPVPTHVVARADGGVWIAGAGTLLRVDRTGGVLARVETSPIEGLALLPDGAALTLEVEQGSRTLRRTEEAGRRWGRLELRPLALEARWLVANGSRALLGNDAELCLVTWDERAGGFAVLERRQGGGREGVASSGGEWLVLSSDGRILERLSARLEPREANASTRPSLHVAATATAQWLAEPGSTRLRRIPLDGTRPTLHGVAHSSEIQSLLPFRNGLLVLLPGAVLLVGPDGEIERAQGGFDGLVGGSVPPSSSAAPMIGR